MAFRIIIKASLAVLSFLMGLTFVQARSKAVIFDTDWWTDVDDACALRILINADRRGEVDLKGICLSAVNSTSVPSIKAFIANEKAGPFLLGADFDATDFKGKPKYRETILNNAPAQTSDGAEDCVPFYRSILARSREKVDIIAVGFPNALAKLLKSPPDKYSPLDGKALVKKKVSHLWMMAGNYPSGKEHNFTNGPRSREAGSLICSEWPGQITFLGYEVGVRVVIGGKLTPDDLLHKVLAVHGSANGRYAWDPMTARLCIGGNLKKEGYYAVRGTNVVNPEDGSNRFAESSNGRHRYVVMLHEPQWYEDRLNPLLTPSAPSAH